MRHTQDEPSIRILAGLTGIQFELCTARDEKLTKRSRHQFYGNLKLSELRAVFHCGNFDIGESMYPVVSSLRAQYRTQDKRARETSLSVDNKLQYV